MISVETVIHKLRLAEAGASAPARQCGLHYREVLDAMNSLRIFDGKGQGGLSAAASHLSQAQSTLEQLQSCISTAILQLSK